MPTRPARRATTSSSTRSTGASTSHSRRRPRPSSPRSSRRSGPTPTPRRCRPRPTRPRWATPTTTWSRSRPRTGSSSPRPPSSSGCPRPEGWSGSSRAARSTPPWPPPSLTGIPTGARVLDAQFQMWAVTTIGATTGLLDVHALTRSFDEAAATWNRASSTTLWTRPGGDFNATAASSVTGVTNDPEWQSWTTTGVVQGWLTTPSTNHGLLVKMRDEVASSQRSMLLSGEAAEKLLQPKLVVTYLEKTSESTYHAPYTPARMIPGDEYPVDVTLTNTTTTTWPAASRVLSYRWTLPDGTDVTTGGNQIETALPQDVSPGEVVTVHARVRTPIQSG